GLDRPLQPERLAAKGRLVLFVTHRKPSFLQNASETAEAADVSPVPDVRESLFETRSAASLLHPVKNCQRLKCASTRSAARASTIARCTAFSRPNAIDRVPRSTGKTRPSRPEP